MSIDYGWNRDKKLFVDWRYVHIITDIALSDCFEQKQKHLCQENQIDQEALHNNNPKVKRIISTFIIITKKIIFQAAPFWTGSILTMDYDGEPNLTVHSAKNLISSFWIDHNEA